MIQVPVYTHVKIISRTSHNFFYFFDEPLCTITFFYRYTSKTTYPVIKVREVPSGDPTNVNEYEYQYIIKVNDNPESLLVL